MTDSQTASPLGESARFSNIIRMLAETIDARTDASPDTSYTAKLLSKGPKKVAQKVAEEGTELAIALVSETDEAVANEAADLIYHTLVALKTRSISLDVVAEVLASREGISGLDEKAARRES
ncbi:MAG: phosphoribosyl-ATP diphosphatase [Pseudomonadota bacterium]